MKAYALLYIMLGGYEGGSYKISIHWTEEACMDEMDEYCDKEELPRVDAENVNVTEDGHKWFAIGGFGEGGDQFQIHEIHIP